MEINGDSSEAVLSDFWIPVSKPQGEEGSSNRQHVLIKIMKSCSFQNALELLETDFFKYDVSCTNTVLYKNQAAQRSFLDLSLNYFSLGHSFICVDSGSNKVLGILISAVRPSTYKHYDPDNQVLHNSHEDVMFSEKIRNYLLNKTLYKYRETYISDSKFLEVILVCGSRSCDYLALESEMLRSVEPYAVSLGINSIIAVSNDFQHQVIFSELGYEKIGSTSLRLACKLNGRSPNQHSQGTKAFEMFIKIICPEKVIFREDRRLKDFDTSKVMYL